jgi:hypothetical protein
MGATTRPCYSTAATLLACAGCCNRSDVFICGEPEIMVVHFNFKTLIYGGSSKHLS